ncbi:MAG: hypothetical protein R3B45_08385 [Bdellovibrionota bacterium]
MGQATIAIVGAGAGGFELAINFRKKFGSKAYTPCVFFGKISYIIKPFYILSVGVKHFILGFYFIRLT